MKNWHLVLISVTLLLAAGHSLADTVNEEWVKTYDTTSNFSHMLSDIAVDNSGNVYVTGTRNNSGVSDIVTIKYNSAGAAQWTNTFSSGYGADSAAAIAVDNSGNVYVAGQSNTAISETTLCRIIKYNSAGVQKWAITYQGSNNTGPNQLNDIEVDSSGDIYVLGECTTKTTGVDYVTIKYHNTGTKIWDMTYNSTGTINDDATDMELDSAGNVFVTGHNGTVKYNTNGDEQWSNNSSGFALAVDSSSSVYLVDNSGTFHLTKYNWAGIMQFSSFYQPPQGSNAYPTDIAVDASGNAYLTGILTNPVNIVTVKFDNTGVFAWDAILEVTNQVICPGSIACDQWGGVYVADFADDHLITAKYDKDGNEKWKMFHPLNVNISSGSGLTAAIFVKAGEVYSGCSDYASALKYNYVTVKYSQHFCKQIPAGDLNQDCIVDYKDLAIMAAHWTECNLYPSCDGN